MTRIIYDGKIIVYTVLTKWRQGRKYREQCSVLDTITIYF